MPKKSKTLWWVLGLTGVLVLVAGWSYYINPDRQTVVFYSSSSKHSQQFDAAGIHQVVLRVSAADVQVERVPSQIIEIEGIITYSIQGYHPSGPWTEPEPLSDEQKKFTSSITDGVLTILSPEWQHIHHAMIYDELTVRIPIDVPIEFVPLLLLNH